jgi:hypothetical protein
MGKKIKEEVGGGGGSKIIEEYTCIPELFMLNIE